MCKKVNMNVVSQITHSCAVQLYLCYIRILSLINLINVVDFIFQENKNVRLITHVHKQTRHFQVYQDLKPTMWYIRIKLSFHICYILTEFLLSSETI